MKNYESRDKKLKKRKNKMRISGRSLLTVIESIILKKATIVKNSRKIESDSESKNS